MGLARWAFIPASRVRFCSSAKASAVMAMMGTAAASGRPRARMALVASMPFITGIRTSMRMASNQPGAEPSNCSRASCPFSAVVTTQPTSSRMSLAT